MRTFLFTRYTAFCTLTAAFTANLNIEGKKGG